MSDDVNIVAWAYAADGTCGGAEMVATRELVEVVPDMLKYSMREAVRELFAFHGTIPEAGPFYAILEPNPPFKILKEGTL